jgi:hypothetical protein
MEEHAHLLSRKLASRVIDVHVPLVQGGAIKCSLALRAGDARVLLAVDKRAAAELKQPRCTQGSAELRT